MYFLFPTVDASKAGSGNIEIMINDGDIACSVQNHGNYKFTASFMPTTAEYHRIEMKFNAEQVPGKAHVSFLKIHVYWIMIFSNRQAIVKQ